MPRDSWVGVHECQQSVAGGLATFSHPSLPHLTQRVMLCNARSCGKLTLSLRPSDMKRRQSMVYYTFLATAVTVGETEGAMDSTSVFFWPLLLPIAL